MAAGLLPRDVPLWPDIDSFAGKRPPLVDNRSTPEALQAYQRWQGRRLDLREWYVGRRDSLDSYEYECPDENGDPVIERLPGADVTLRRAGRGYVLHRLAQTGRPDLVRRLVTEALQSQEVQTEAYAEQFVNDKDTAARVRRLAPDIINPRYR